MCSRNTAIHYIQSLVSEAEFQTAFAGTVCCDDMRSAECSHCTQHRTDRELSLLPLKSSKYSYLQSHAPSSVAKVSETLLFKKLGSAKDGGTCLQNQGSRGRRIAS